MNKRVSASKQICTVGPLGNRCLNYRLSSAVLHGLCQKHQVLHQPPNYVYLKKRKKKCTICRKLEEWCRVRSSFWGWHKQFVPFQSFQSVTKVPVKLQPLPDLHVHAYCACRQQIGDRLILLQMAMNKTYRYAYQKARIDKEICSQTKLSWLWKGEYGVNIF